MNINRLRASTGIIVLIESVLIFAPLIILGGAINWPASLDEPASIVLPQIVQKAGAVQLGYFIYLLYSILFLAVAVLVSRVIDRAATISPLMHVAIGLGIGSAVLRVLGIIRWLFAMPLLARVYVDPASTDQARETVTILYDMLNTYAGQIGELLGVNLFAALWLTLVSVAILRSDHLPRWLGVFGLGATAGLYAALLEVAGVDLGAFISVSATVLHLWFMALGGVLVFGKAAQPGSAAAVKPA